MPEGQGWETEHVFARYKLVGTVLSLNPSGSLWQALDKLCSATLLGAQRRQAQQRRGVPGAWCESGCISSEKRSFWGEFGRCELSVYPFSFCPVCGHGHEFA